MPKGLPRIADLPSIETENMHPKIEGDEDNVDAGIGLYQVEYDLVVYMARPDNTPVFTTFRLYWGNIDTPIATKILYPGDEALKRIAFTIPSENIRELIVDPVHVEVRRPSGNPSYTLPLRLRVYLRRPGGRDINPSPGNQKLVFQLPIEIVLYGLSDERAREGVEVLFRYWENMAAYDRIFLAWGSQTVTRWIQPSEVGTDIKVTVSYETIRAAGKSDLMPIAYRVEGPTGNKSDPWEPWSEEIRLRVYLDDKLLARPWLEFPDSGFDIDLETLDENDVQVGLYIFESDTVAYSRVFIIWAGVDAEGGSVPHTDSQIIMGAGSYFFPIPYKLVKAIARGSAAVNYFLTGEGQKDKPSDYLFLNVHGNPARWPAPSIDEAPDKYLDPNVPKATIRFPRQLTWESQDILTIVILAKGNDTIEYSESLAIGEFPPGDQMVLDVPGHEINKFDGRSIEGYYSVRHRDETPRESLRREWQVGNPLLSDLTSFDRYNWNMWENTVTGKGDLTIDGAENICWRATKTASELIEPGIKKYYSRLKQHAKYELSFYCKSTGSSAISEVKIDFSGMVINKSLSPNKNWVKLSESFELSVGDIAINKIVSISFENNTTHTFLVDQIQLTEVLQ